MPGEPLSKRSQILLLITLASVFIKLVFFAYLDNRVYGDVIRAVTFGYAVDQGIFSVDRDFIRSKTFLGPHLWFYTYKTFGAHALHALNLALFLALVLVHVRLGRTGFDERVVLVALFLFAFYPGTNRNVIAGETDDNLAALLFALGILLYVSSRKIFFSALLMGLGFLFKFWVAIFCFGFVVYLLRRKAWRETFITIGGMISPFLVLNFLSGFSSLPAFASSLKLSRGYSNWTQVGFKMLSTGMIFAVSISGLQWWKNKTNYNSLLFFVSSMYVVYVITNVDAFAASYVMMCCLMFSSFLIAEWLTGFERRWLGMALILYFVISTAITYRNLYGDTDPLVIITNRKEIQKMFP